jgi:hypothetical protein
MRLSDFYEDRELIEPGFFSHTQIKQFLKSNQKHFYLFMQKSSTMINIIRQIEVINSNSARTPL